MNAPEIMWEDTNFSQPYIRVLRLAIPAQWWIDKRYPQILLAWWLIKMAWNVLTIKRLWK